MNKQRNDLVSKTMHQFQARLGWQHWAETGVQDDAKGKSTVGKEGVEVKAL